MNAEQIKQLIEEAMHKNLINSKEEAANAIGFVQSLFQIMVQELEANEPHATNTIKQLTEAEYQVYELHDLIEEYL